MILVADSGSTKTTWLLADDFGNTRQYQSLGINPFFRSTEDIVAELKPLFAGDHLPLRAIHFYGAGVVSTEKAGVIAKALTALFGDVSCQVSSDMLGAARALCGTQPGIVCILGTGSNACYYNGSAIVKNIPPMGFILGDEGSGAVIGRQLVSDFFKEVMPAHLREKFVTRFNISKDEVLERVYRTEKPNRYLAGFTPFLSENRDERYCCDLLRSQFGAFVQRNVKQLPESAGLPVHVAGSVAFYFREILGDVLRSEGLQPGLIQKEPIEYLLRFHLQK